ncbi:HpcH/HpaI aldolase/citrate lyase family protein [Nocardia sp. NPDC060256]|uniref:HpcH/HpaI aldolase/citrate lyase family protein n=1 Tax=unclassified Nocardia TaxID=2637762 RepID=UPI00364678D3
MRSALYVPGSRPELFDKAMSSRADVVLLDLEDSVPLAAKDRARNEVSAWLGQVRADGPQIWVRVNPGSIGEADLAAVAVARVAAVCLAKTESAAQVNTAGAVLREFEPRPGAIRICPLLESAAAVLASREIAAAPRVARLQLGETDLCADIGVDPSPDDRELWAARAQVVLASAAARIAPPLGPVRTDFNDLDALRISTISLARMGFRGRACIHPAQVAIVNEVFTPNVAELEKARDLVARFDAAGGEVLDEAGRMVDLAVVRRARRLLENTVGPA